VPLIDSRVAPGRYKFAEIIPVSRAEEGRAGLLVRKIVEVCPGRSGTTPWISTPISRSGYGGGADSREHFGGDGEEVPYASRW